MSRIPHQRVSEAINSMLRTDYISLNDVEKLSLLAEYYVDYFDYLPQILTENDQLLVGRRGTGKTTLVYRAYIECMRSWHEDGGDTLTRPRTLGIYIDLSKCQSLESAGGAHFDDFEHVFVTELCDSINEQLNQFWPSLSSEPNLISRLFYSTEQKKTREVKKDLQKLASLLQQGLPRITRSGPKKVEETQRKKGVDKSGVSSSISLNAIGLSADLSSESELETSVTTSSTEQTTYRISIADVLRILKSLRENASIPAIFIFIDEFSSLSVDLQGRFTTLLRKILGTHAGVFVKICAITDNFTLGSSIILQRDLFEISLDLDSYIERNNSLNQAMLGLRDQAKSIFTSRLEAFNCPAPEQIIDSPDEAWELLSREAMGVPRTLGIVLQQAWSRRQTGGASKIRTSDIEYGIRYASKAYQNHLIGASKDGVAIPAHVAEMWYSLLDCASKERKKGKSASHFLLLPRYEETIKYLSMFFLVHLLIKGRTTKKDSTSRSLYCFDYGMCLGHNLAFTSDKNILRQQRFIYDETIALYEQIDDMTNDQTFQCEKCHRIYNENEILVGGKPLKFCPEDRADLKLIATKTRGFTYTEEEIKIIGAIKSSTPRDRLVARRIADDVGCYTQKVAKFGEKLEKEQLIERRKDENEGKYIYYNFDKKQSN